MALQGRPATQHVRGEGGPAEGPQEPDGRLRCYHGPVHDQHHDGAQEGTYDRRRRREDDVEAVETVSQHSDLSRHTTLSGIHQGILFPSLQNRILFLT